MKRTGGSKKSVKRKRSRAGHIGRRLGHIGILLLITLAVVLPFLPTTALVTGSVTKIRSLVWPAYRDIRYSTQDNSPSATNPISVFDRGVVTLTFDDSWRSIYSNALQLMEDHSFNSTQYVLTGTVNDPTYMTEDQIEAFKRGGHQIASHSVTHPNLTRIDQNQLHKEVTDSKRFLEKRYGQIKDFASPLGAFNDNTLNAIRANYRSHRSTQVGFNTRDNLDIYNIKVQNITPSTTTEEFAGWLQEAKAGNSWLVLVYHQIDHGGDDYSATPEAFKTHLDLLDASELYVATMDEVLNEIQ